MESRERNAAITAARAAGEIIRESYNQKVQVWYKGPANMVTEVDQRSEQRIVDILQDLTPNYGIIAEEGSQVDRSDQPVWLIDPLDGTTNFAHGYPHFCVSIALRERGHTRLGVVFQPLLGELYWAEPGQGAWLNDQRLQVSDTGAIDQALIASGFPYDAWSNPNDNTAEWAQLVKQAQSLRCDGSAALNLCYVAAGRLDACWELDLEAWDMAAGALIVEEAGGIVSQVDGSPFSLTNRNVLAANRALHTPLIASLLGRTAPEA